MANENNAPYDPYIPSGGAPNAGAQGSNNRTAALQAVRSFFSLALVCQNILKTWWTMVHCTPATPIAAAEVETSTLLLARTIPAKYTCACA